jgi:hypothetical protein
MYPLALVTLGAAGLALTLSVTLPRDVDFFSRTQADTTAANFWAYRDALVAYQNDHYASTNGYISEAVLATPNPPIRPRGYLPLGFTVLQTGTPAANLWRSYFVGGRLYTFSTIAAANLPSGVVDAIANHRGRSLMMGIHHSDGAMHSLYHLDTAPFTGGGFPLPVIAAIPQGALVVIGN